MGRSAFLPVVAVVAAFACASERSADSTTMPLRTCGLKVWHRPANADAHVEIVGDWDDWRRPGTVPATVDDGWRVALIATPPGEHAYAIVEDGQWLTDKGEPMTDMHDGHEVSVATAADCTRPALRVDGVDPDATSASDGKVTVQATFLSAESAAKIAPGSIGATPRRSADPALEVTGVDPERGTVSFAVRGLARGKHTYTLAASDTNGVAAEDARATVWIEGGANAAKKEPWDPRDAIVYQVVIDRFRKASGPLAPPATPASRAGGTLAGVKKALDSGEIEALGASAIWLSPLYANPTKEFTGSDGRSYTSYHGYWPVASRALDSRFASEGELDAFMTSAHARGIRVLFDVVPNHVHADHPYTKAHPEWFKPDCVCGQGSCDWGTHVQTCWFATYLPDLDWSNHDAAEAEAQDVLWWFDRWDADGIRIDAVPMMPRSATRRIATVARRRYQHPGNSLYVLGENFTGPTGYQSLRYDLGPYGLDGSFHFPLMWAMREAIATEKEPLSAIEASFRAGEDAWAGSNAVMGLMIGNHDVARFASVSAGTADGDTWEPPPQPLEPSVYAKQRVALGAVLTLPGAPVLYYGDEVGLAGRSDPDCRRVMPAEEELIDAQRETRDLARKVGKARACSRALRRGALKTLLADRERFVFAREIDGEVAVVVLTRRPADAKDVALPPSVTGSLVDVVTGDRVDTASHVLKIGSDFFAVHVYLPATTPCAK